MVLSILALARPYSGLEEIERPYTGHDRVLVLDISRSMETKDVAPSRLAFAKRKAHDIVNYVTSNTPGDRLGIVLFAGEAYVYAPLTADYGAIETFINSIQVELITVPGSSLERALEVTEDSFKRVDATFPQVIVLSDGEENLLNVERAAKVISTPVNLMGIGTTDGLPIDLGNGAYLKDSQGQIVISKLNEESLTRLASLTGGKYSRWSLDDSDIIALLNDGIKSDVESSAQKITIYHEIGPFLLWVPLLGIVAAIFLRKEHLVFLFAFALLNTSTRADDLYDAAKAYDRGDYSEALKAFKNLYDSGDDRQIVLEGIARSYYRAGDVKAAEAIFSEITKKSPSVRQKFEAHFNQGNANFRQQEWDKAIHSYEDALKIKADDAPTRFNLDLAKKAKEQSKNPDERKDDQDKKEGEKDPQTSPSPSPSPNSTPSPEESKSDESSDSKESTSSSPSPSSSEAPSGNSSSSPSSETTPSSTESEEPPQHAEAAPTPADVHPLAEQEAKEWLDSLPESPVLLRRRTGRAPDPDQTW